MARSPSQIYKSVCNGPTKFDKEKHCTTLLKCMEESGTMSSFCVKAGIGDGTFYSWLNKHQIFMDCYRIGCMIARENWEKEGRDGKGQEGFDIEMWRAVGSMRFGVGKTNRVRVHIDADSTPYDQYRQLMTQASMGDFTAAELKQLMESINIGIRAYESFELQKEVEAMRNDLSKMNQDNGNNIVAIKAT